MSGAGQKQQQPPPPQSVVSQSQQPRFPQGTYTIPPRPPTPQRTDGFHVGTSPAYVQQPPNQVNNTVPPLRGMPPTGPPTQASTPPNNDLKVQQISQQPLNLAYIQQSNIRPNPNQSYYPRAPPPTNQTRMTNHRQGQQPNIYPQQSQHFLSMTMPHMFATVQQNHLTYYNGSSRPPAANFPNYSIIGPANMQFTYPAQPPATPQSYYFNTNPQLLQRSTTQVPAGPQNPAQPSPAAAMAMQPPIQPISQPPKNKRRSNAIPIIDPSTGRDRLSEMYEQEQDGSHPPSGESSARQTPQPPIPNINKDVPAIFSKQVAQARDKDEPVVEELELPVSSIHDPLGHMYLTPNQAVNTTRSDLVVQQSKLQAATKEFVPSSAILNAAKETTPVVSAITDAVEVTITTNKPKDRESPAKIRKQREQQQQYVALSSRENKDAAGSKDVAIVEKMATTAVTSSVASSSFLTKEDGAAVQPKENVQNLTACSLPHTIKDATVASSSDKKNIKKDKVDKPSTAVSEDSSLAPITETTTPASIPENLALYTNAKSKSHASQKAVGEGGQKQQQHQQPVGAPSSVVGGNKTAPQKVVTTTRAAVAYDGGPAKQFANKNNKNHELNLKGASKEGTDMDAFNDNIVAPILESANHSKNVDNLLETNETVEFVNNINNNLTNANNVNNNNVTEITVVPTKLDDAAPLSKIETAAALKKSCDTLESNTTIPTPPPTVSSSNVPAAAAATTAAAAALVAPVESKDEIDRSSSFAANIKETLISSKVEIGTIGKSHGNDSGGEETKSIASLEVKPSLPYAEGQWSPSNPSGKKIYGRDFLLALMKDPKSLKKPDNLLSEIVRNEDKGRVGDISRFGCRGGTDFAPNFSTNSFPNKSSSQRGAISKRKSQQGPASGSNKSGNSNSNNKPPIRFSLSLRDDIKLSETENAWKPSHMIASANMSEYEKKSEELYKKVRGVLNRLTPQKFQTLVDQVRNLKIDTCDRLQGVIDLVFEKAIDEPNFSIAYALMCRELALIQVPANKDSKEETVNFRKLLVTRCQMEFEKNSVDESVRNAKVAEMENCQDAERKKEMQIDLEEYDRKLRMKSVGNIRFIGELYKQTMLTISIMQRCVNNLLEHRDEESLECLCKLLSTIGRNMEVKHNILEEVFEELEKLADKRNSKISSRVRFMIQDVIDLRKSNWVPRRQDLNPKTMDQIQKEAENEQMMIQSLNSMAISSRRDDRGGPSGGGGGGGGGGSGGGGGKSSSNKNYGSTEDGWSTAPSRGNKTLNIQREKLKSKPPNGDEPLGSALTFGSWGRGASIKTIPQNTNAFAALDSLSNDFNSDKRSNIGKYNNKGPYNSKGPSLERIYNRSSYDDNRGSRSNSQQRSRDSSSASQRGGSSSSSFVSPMPSYNMPVKQEQESTASALSGVPKPSPVESAVAASAESSSSAPATSRLTTEQDLQLLERKVVNIIEEYINNCCTLDDCDVEFKQFIPVNLHPQLISAACLKFLERSEVARVRTGELIAYLYGRNTVSLENYSEGLGLFLEECKELVIDIPTIWQFLAELIAPILWEKGGLTLKQLVIPLKRLESSANVKKLLAAIFKLSVLKRSLSIVKDIWRSSQDGLRSLLSESEIESFIKDNKLESLSTPSGAVGPVGAASAECALTYDEIYVTLMKFFETKTCDEILNWILANVGLEKTREVAFIRTLATACFEASISKGKLKAEQLIEKYTLLHRFVDTKPAYELACLFALQALVKKLEHPPGLLLTVCTQLWEDGVFSHNSFLQWETSNDPAEQDEKGVALKQLTSFFLELKEPEEISSEEENDEGGA